MEPGIWPGDVVVTSGVDVESARDLKIGDVITFLPYPDDPTLVTHRITAKSVSAQGYSFVTQGDNNSAPDAWGPVHDYQIRGKVLYVVPKIGYVRAWVGPAIKWVIPGVAGALLLYAVVGFGLSFRREKVAASSAEMSTAGGAVSLKSPRRAVGED
jgi:signal peptidase